MQHQIPRSNGTADGVSAPPSPLPALSDSIRSVTLFHGTTVHTIPHALEAVHAGFPSVAQDYFISDFSFDETIITNPSTTYAVNVAGDSMEGAGIYDGDILLVDCSLPAHDGDIVIAIVNAEMTVKRLRQPHASTPYLQPENPRYPNIRISEGSELDIWGVVIGNYHFQHRTPPQHPEIQTER
jgi:DNA polymerase V